MSSCVLPTPEFRRLQRSTGLQEGPLKASIAYCNEVNGEWPPYCQAWRLPGVNSEKAFRESLKVNETYNSTDLETVLDYTNTTDLDSAIIELNQNHFTDAITTGIQLDKKVILNRTQLPSPYVQRNSESVDHTQNTFFIESQLDQLATLYGINTHSVSTSDLQALGILEKVPESAQVSAFILNGDIYVNTDHMTANSRGHEMLHVLLGSIKYTMPQVYEDLINTVRGLENIDYRASLYSGRTEHDILEEIFVEEYSRYLKGYDSYLNELDPRMLNRVNASVSHMLDIILQGDNSVELLPKNVQFGLTLRDLADNVNAHTMKLDAQGFLNSATMHRIMGNLKSNLMKSGNLKEVCK